MNPTKTVLFFLLACALAPIVARAGECLPINVRNLEGNYVVPGVMGDIVYRRVNGRELSLDAYVQKHGRKRPSVIVVHGGGWDSGSRVAFVGQFLEMLTRAGYNWFSVDYRLGGIQNYKDALDDLRAAIEFIRCNAKRFRIDPYNIALFGEDAGAHLAAMLLTERPEGVKAAVLIGGFYDLREIPNLKSRIPNLESRISNSEFLAEASPITHVSHDMPAAMIVHGAADREAPPGQANRFCDAMRQSGGHCQYVEVDGAIHRAENWTPGQWGYKDTALSWLGGRLDLRFPNHDPFLSNLKKGVTFDRLRRLKLDAYIPKGPGPFPAVIIAHGGGWEAGDKVTYVTPLFEPLAMAGFAWFSIDYRLTPQYRHQDQIQDLREAIRFVRANGKTLRIDPNRIAVIGESASGQMAALLATRVSKRSGSQGRRRIPFEDVFENDPNAEFAAAVSLYGVYDFEAMTGELTPRSIPSRLFGITALDNEARATLRRYSPLRHAREKMIPLLLVCGTNDGLFAQHNAFANELHKAGADFDAITLEGAPHGMENWEGRPEWMDYKTKLVEWLKAKLAPRK
ncbi:MAG TPA: alpha/beta hydrolase [Blastocatellia bacterium]|nr:alpha/beta hydrolase [Blastocatellia bacterium]